MKNLKKIIGALFIILSILTYGCSKILEEPVYSQLAPENFLTTKNGIVSTLAESYSNASNMSGNHVYQTLAPEEMTTDELFQTGGGDSGPASLLLNFTWDASNSLGYTFMWANWGFMWAAIRNTNIVLDNVDNVAGMSDDEKNELQAEARFVRVYAYYKLWNQFGPMPIRKSTKDPLELPRATTEEFQNFMESELSAIIPVLPDPGKEPNYGRANSGAARALLTKWYLNTYQWQKSADMAKEIIDKGFYHLYPDYNQMFALANERNSEFIWVQPALANQPDAHNAITAPSFPPGFLKTVDFNYPVTFSGWSNFASQFRLRDKFVNSFALDDQRDDRILKKYINTTGDTIDLIKDFKDDARGLKYPPDPNASGALHGNDFPFLRYADILLARAEALNELDGPNQESIDLINQIRNRAGLADVQLQDFSSGDELRDQLLKERGWEFWYESKRRRDLIRMGKFIDYAHLRGVANAAAKDTLFPLPQSALDANPLLVQNSGY